MSEREHSQPNVLVILADQLRYDCIGFGQHSPVSTPNIDRLARNGAWFDRAYTHIPICSPARQSFLVGKRPETFGSLWNYGIGSKISALEPDQATWPRHLQELGYETSHIGKWNIHPLHGPSAYGYHSHVDDGTYHTFRARDYGHIEFTNGFFGEVDPVPLEATHTHWLAQQAIGHLSSHRDTNSPWCMHLDFTEPHLPCRPHQTFADMYDPQHIPPWESFQERFRTKPYIQKQMLHSWNIDLFTWDDWAPIVARYYATISQLDDAIGLILDHLEATAVLDDTLIIFTADHGDMCGGHRMIDKHYVMYEDVVHVPLIVHWPKRIQPQIRSEFVYNLLDVAPTILQASDHTVPSGYQGQSLLPLLTSNRNQNWRTAIVSTYHGQQFGLYSQRMICYDDWKYVWNGTDVDELYHLAEDPGELNNRIYDPAAHGITSELRQQLYAVLEEEGDTLVQNEWMKRQLLDNRKL